MIRHTLRYLWSAVVVAVLAWICAPLLGLALLLSLLGVGGDL